MPVSILDHEGPEIQTRHKLQAFVSPVCSDPDNHVHNADAPGPSSRLPTFKDGAQPLDQTTLPQLRRYEEPSLLEVFYDLFFAANYTVFSQNQSVTSVESFKSYIGYFSLLWATWFSVTLYDVRYIADSLFERITRATQLGVLVGFAVTAPNFDPDKQTDKNALKTMKIISLILCFSRFCLAVEYLTILYHVRRFKRAHIPLIGQACINAIAGVIFLGVSFRFEQGRQSHIFYAWYIVSALEAITTLVVSNFSRVLGFTRTHLMKRMTLLTIMILGDGIIAVAQDVVTIVKTADAWNPKMIGVVTAATATIYFVFLVYHDWMHHPYLPAIRQQIWTILHYPFHLSLILFMQGFTQIIVWTKALDLFVSLTGQWLQESIADPSAYDNPTTQLIVDSIKESTDDFFKTYPPKYFDSWEITNAAIHNISTIPDKFWKPLFDFESTGDYSNMPIDLQLYLLQFGNASKALITVMINTCFQALGIDIEGEARKKHPDEATDTTTGAFQDKVSDKTLRRYELVFAYTYISAGLALIFLTLLSIISRTSPWTRWPIARTTINLLLAIGMSCTATLYFHEDNLLNFLFSAWVLPVVMFVWLIVSINTHIRGGMMAKFRRGKAFVKDKKDQYQHRGEYAAVAVPMATWQEGHGGTEPKNVAAVASASVTPGSVDRPGSLFGQTTPHALSHPVQAGYFQNPSYAGGVEYGHPQQGYPAPYDPVQPSTEYRGAGSYN